MTVKKSKCGKYIRVQLNGSDFRLLTPLAATELRDKLTEAIKEMEKK